jgi:predicted site-specific integrase-resolvase
MSKRERVALKSCGEVARVYGVSTRAVQRWCEESRVEFERTPGGRLRLVVDPDTGLPLARESGE